GRGPRDTDLRPVPEPGERILGADHPGEPLRLPEEARPLLLPEPLGREHEVGEPRLARPEQRLNDERRWRGRADVGRGAAGENGRHPGQERTAGEGTRSPDGHECSLGRSGTTSHTGGSDSASRLPNRYGRVRRSFMLLSTQTGHPADVAKAAGAG